MHPLIERCLRGDREAWTEFWLTYDAVAARPVRRLLVRAGFGEREAENVVQDLYVHLRENDYERLRSFRGTTDQELTMWLVQVSANFTRNWLESAIQRRKHERGALAHLAEEERREATTSMTAGQKRKARGHLEKRDTSGPSEEELDVFLREVDKIAPEEAARLRMLAGRVETSAPGGKPSQAPEPTVTERTLSRWLIQLFEKYRALLRRKS